MVPGMKKMFRWISGMRWLNFFRYKDISHFNFIVNPVGVGTINPTLHYLRTLYSTIPSFQL